MWLLPVITGQVFLVATVRERRIFTTEEVLELLEGDDDNTQINYDSSV